MEGQSSVSKQAKFSRRILCSKRRILRSPMLNEHPGYKWSLIDKNRKLDCMEIKKKAFADRHLNCQLTPSNLA